VGEWYVGDLVITAALKGECRGECGADFTSRVAKECQSSLPSYVVVLHIDEDGTKHNYQATICPPETGSMAHLIDVVLPNSND
jgi:hypothetical protein